MSEEIKEGKKKLTKTEQKVLKLPRYMRLAKGGIWSDKDDNLSSGVTIFAFNRVMVGKNPSETSPDPAVDKFDNKNLRDYGYIEKELPWYVDLSTIPKEKLGRIIIAYNAGILVAADPTTPPEKEKLNVKSDWKVHKDKGELIFNGSNKEMFVKLQNYSPQQLKDFVDGCPLTETAKNNLLDLLDYEKRGFNKLSRPRFEILNLIKKKLNQYGPSISAIRQNDIGD